MKFIFHEDAENEFNEAIEYYNRCEKNLALTLQKKFTLPSKE